MLEGFKDMLGVDDKEKVEEPAAAPAAPPAPPAPPAPTSGSMAEASAITGRTYKVKKGDNLHKIAEKFDVKWRDIAELNHLKNPDLIHPGDVFKIPDA